MTAVQDAFIIPEGAAGALAELERRKFTAEEGVSGTCLSVYVASLHMFPGPSDAT
jgi:ATP-dependent RNA helicase DDX35